MGNFLGSFPLGLTLLVVGALWEISLGDSRSDTRYTNAIAAGLPCRAGQFPFRRAGLGPTWATYCLIFFSSPPQTSEVQGRPVKVGERA